MEKIQTEYKYRIFQDAQAMTAEIAELISVSLA